MKVLYLHGFASGPESSKGVHLAKVLGGRGIPVERMNLRLPSLERLRLGRMIDAVVDALGDGAALLGSSLGGLVAARVAERDPRAKVLVLLAPAFRFTETWPARLGPEQMAAWRREGLEIEDHARHVRTRIDYGFMEEAIRLESAGPPRVAAPTLIFHGRRDDVVDVAVSREWAAGHPEVRLVETDDVHDLKASLPVIEREAAAFLEPFFPRRAP